MTKRLSHVSAEGKAEMVDVADKAVTYRVATARAIISMAPETIQAIREASLKKGDVLTTARLAGIMAAKRTDELIPLCHALPLSHVQVEVATGRCEVEIIATASTHGKTGVEMEALTAASIAALTVYDMAKAVDREMTIREVKLLEKRGGASGDYKASI